MTRGEVLERVEFDPKLRVYLVLQGALGLLASIVGIVLVPLWLVAGPLWARRYYERLECLLTRRSLVYKKGIAFRSETTIPLDKIQDLSVNYGPVLDMLGLAKLKVLTAGHHANQGATIGLVGVVGAPAFRDRVLERRDELTERAFESHRSTARGTGPEGARGVEAGEGAEGAQGTRGTVAAAGAPAARDDLERIATLLEEIRDLLASSRGPVSSPARDSGADA